jgi:hypothetical protein
LERSYVAKATQPRRRILQSRILFHNLTISFGSEIFSDIYDGIK